MAQIPNAYYNSPWIRDAAQNLASALAPPDPEKMAARRKLEWELGRAQEIAAHEEEVFGRRRKADESLAKVTRFAAEPIRNPLTNEIDERETNRQSVLNLADVFENGGVDYVNAGMKAAGPSAPSFAVSEAIAGINAANRSSQIGQQIEGALAGARMREEGDTRRLVMNFDHDKTMSAIDLENKMKLLAAEQEGNLKAIQARAKLAGGNPLTIAGTALNDLTRLMYQQVQQSGSEMERGPFSELVARAAILMSQGRNAPTAVLEAYRKHVNEQDVDVDDGGFWGKSHRYLKPHFDDPLPPAAGPTNLGTVVTPGAAVAPAPAAAPAAGQFREGDTMRSKSGKPMIFRNEQWEYE